MALAVGVGVFFTILSLIALIAFAYVGAARSTPP
jgi:hypothetical protein